MTSLNHGRLISSKKRVLEEATVIKNKTQEITERDWNATAKTRLKKPNKSKLKIPAP